MNITLTDIALIGSFDTIGPSFLSSVNEKLFSMDKQVMFASRVVIMCGMAHQQTESKKIVGPVPVSELEEGKYEFYYFQMRPNITPDKRLHLILCIVFEVKSKKEIRNLEEVIEGVLIEGVREIDWRGFGKSGLLPNKVQYYKEIIKKLLTQLNSIPIEERTGSLFDISYISNLPEEIQIAAKRFMFAKNGILETEFVDEKEAIKELVKKGLIKSFEKEGNIYFKAR